jgi:hypothetical protein
VFSLFEIIYMTIRDVGNRWLNSFQVYLEQIDQDTEMSYFTQGFDKSNADSSGIRLEKLEADYFSYCRKNELHPEKIRQQTKLLSYYNLELVKVTSSKTSILMHVRWRHPGEKRDEQTQYQTSLAKFLIEECKHSIFEEDYIFVTEFDKTYRYFCQKNNFDTEDIDRLINIREFQKFGIKYADYYTTTYVNGITERNNKELEDSNKTKFVRIPVNIDIKKNKYDLERLLFRFRLRFFSYNGWFVSFLTVLVQVGFLFAIPFLVTLFTILVRFTAGKINEDPYETTYNFFDILSPSTQDSWISKTEGLWSTLIFFDFRYHFLLHWVN